MTIHEIIHRIRSRWPTRTVQVHGWHPCEFRSRYCWRPVRLWITRMCTEYGTPIGPYLYQEGRVAWLEWVIEIHSPDHCWYAREVDAFDGVTLVKGE